MAEAIHRYGRELGARVFAIYGGSSMRLQLRSLERFRVVVESWSTGLTAGVQPKILGVVRSSMG